MSAVHWLAGTVRVLQKRVVNLEKRLKDKHESDLQVEQFKFMYAGISKKMWISEVNAEVEQEETLDNEEHKDIQILKFRDLLVKVQSSALEKPCTTPELTEKLDACTAPRSVKLNPDAMIFVPPAKSEVIPEVLGTSADDFVFHVSDLDDELGVQEDFFDNSSVNEIYHLAGAGDENDGVQEEADDKEMCHSDSSSVPGGPFDDTPMVSDCMDDGDGDGDSSEEISNSNEDDNCFDHRMDAERVDGSAESSATEADELDPESEFFHDGADIPFSASPRPAVLCPVAERREQLMKEPSCSAFLGPLVLVPKRKAARSQTESLSEWLQPRSFSGSHGPMGEGEYDNKRKSSCSSTPGARTPDNHDLSTLEDVPPWALEVQRTMDRISAELS